jgi:hypothetical protein
MNTLLPMVRYQTLTGLQFLAIQDATSAKHRNRVLFLPTKNEIEAWTFRIHPVLYPRRSGCAQRCVGPTSTEEVCDRLCAQIDRHRLSPNVDFLD